MNNLLWQKDALGRQTTYSYDATGKFLERVTAPIGATHFDYYGDGLVKSVTDDNSRTTNFEYNAAGNLTKIIDPTSKSTSMTYDGAGRMTALEDANGGVSRFGYDNTDNILWTEDPLAYFYPNERHQVDFTYDDRGNQKTFKDAMSNLTSFDYDTMNNLTRVVDAADSTTTYEYDPNFNLSKVIDARGKATSYDYDANDRLESITDPLLKTVAYRYDKVGNSSDTVYPNGNETYYSYFKDNLLKKVWYKTEATSYDFRYNPTHTLKDVTDQSGRAWRFGYDAGDRLTTTTETINSSYGDFIINRSYDGVSHLTGIKAPGETTTSYTYNARDDLTDIDLPGGAVDEIGFGYDDGRNRTSIAMPGNVGNTFGLDPAGRVTTVTMNRRVRQRMRAASSGAWCLSVRSNCVE